MCVLVEIFIEITCEDDFVFKYVRKAQNFKEREKNNIKKKLIAMKK